MIPAIPALRTALLASTVALAATAAATSPPTASSSATPSAAAALAGLPSAPKAAADCLPSGDGYFRARVGGAINARLEWANTGTRCEGEPKSEPPGVRMSFQRKAGRAPNLLFVFGVTGVREGEAAQAAGVNLTVIVQGTSRVYGTLGDSRCTADSLTQRRLPGGDGTYRVEVRGFCTQPAHAVRGNGDVLVSTFEFAGRVDYGPR